MQEVCAEGLGGARNHAQMGVDHGLAGQDHCLHSPGVEGSESLVLAPVGRWRYKSGTSVSGGGAPIFRWSVPTYSSPIPGPLIPSGWSPDLRQELGVSSVTK